MPAPKGEPEGERTEQFCRDSAPRFAPCVRMLFGEMPPRGTSVGKIVLRGTVGEDRKLTDLCLVAADLGDTPRTLECSANGAAGWTFDTEPIGNKVTWPITYWLD